MENSPLISGAYPWPSIFYFVNETRMEAAGTPAKIAWTLENAALRKGWPLGEHLGTECELLERFAIGRETLREAIRMMEGRGSMKMQRGRTGGLLIAEPLLEDVAVKLSAHLHLRGYGEVDLADTAAIADPILAALDKGALVAQLYNRSHGLLATAHKPATKLTGRGTSLAAQLIRSHAEIPEFGEYLGDEGKLCAQLDCSREALREALRILNDFAMLRVQRGRAGGFTLVKPSSGGAIRHLFGFLAARHQTLHDIWPAIEALNLIRLRLALRRLATLDAAARHRYHDIIMTVLRERREPERWFVIYSRLDLVANSKMISTLARSWLAYQARLGLSRTRWRDADETLKASETALVAALWNGDAAAAEYHHSELHVRLAAALGVP